MCSIRNAFYVFLHENINHMVDNFWNMIFVRGIYIVLSWFNNVITMQDRVNHSQKGPFCSHSSIVSKQFLKIILHHAYYCTYASRHSFGKTIANSSPINICFCCHQQFLLLLKLTKMHIYLLMSFIVSVYLKGEIL